MHRRLHFRGTLRVTIVFLVNTLKTIDTPSQ